VNNTEELQKRVTNFSEKDKSQWNVLNTKYEKKVEELRHPFRRNSFFHGRFFSF